MSDKNLLKEKPRARTKHFLQDVQHHYYCTNITRIKNKFSIIPYLTSLWNQTQVKYF